jgi:hypothetical protein
MRKRGPIGARRAGLLSACVAASVVSLVTGDAQAVGTRTFELDSLEKLSGGDLNGVTVGSDGVVRAGWTLGTVPLPAGGGTTATCAVTLADGSVLVGTGPSGGGKVVRVAGDQATIYADTKENAVSALAVDRAGTVYAATTSSKIYRITSGKADPIATLPGVEGVFALAVDKAGTAIYAGTGSDGAVVRVEPSGASSVYFKSDEPFVVSLAMGDDGVLYAGTAGKGLLYRITAPGRATVLYDFHGEDVHAVATGPGGRVYAIANEGASGASSESSESSPARRGASGRNPPGPAASPKPKAGKGALWRFDAQGRPERMMHHDDFHYVSLAVDDHGVAYVGTGMEGRVYSVDDAHMVSLVTDTDERQVTAIGLAGRARYVLGSDPATFHRILGTGGPEAVWTSKALDAGLRARFGHLTWRGTGSLEVSTRSGDTQTPDSTWSAWSAPVAQGGAVQSPAGRFAQVRARLRDAAASLGDVTLAFRTDNLRAVVTEVVAKEHGGPPAKEGLVASGGGPGRHDNVVHLSWKVDNPDEDELRYRVQFRREGGNRWLDATRPDDVVTKAELDWDTSSLPEGKYRLRVQATDEIANPVGEVTEHALESSPVLVDNTPPVFKFLAVRGRRLQAQVVDVLGPIVRVEAAVDGRTEWRPLAAADGLFDTAVESVDTDIAPLLPGGAGAHIIAVRAYDAAGNFVVSEVEAP